jgi:hypothetical protein
LKIEKHPAVEDEAPGGPDLTPYDMKHLITYLRLLDAATVRADWKEVARIVLRRDPNINASQTERCWSSHLARAQWMTKHGYRKLRDQAAGEQGPDSH